MNKIKDNLILAVKGIFYIYLPVIFLLFIVYDLVLGRDMIFYWSGMSFQVIIVGIWSIRNYSQRTIKEEVVDFASIEKAIEEGRWEIIEKGEDNFIVKPLFDPFRIFIDNKVKIIYLEKSAIISGPWYYGLNMAKDIKGRSSFWTKKASGIIALILVIVLISIPIFDDLGLPWKIKENRHQAFIENIQVVKIDSKDKVGNTVENINNQGQGAENDDYLFYVERDLSLVRTNKDYTDKIYLIEKSQGSNISRLNLAGDWIFYTSGKDLNRIRIDGTNNQTIYKSGYALDVHYMNNYLYFINLADNHKVYRIDVNGRGLEKFLDLDARDIALYDNDLIVSYRDDNNINLVESFSLDGNERKIQLKVLANDLIRWDEYYYFIGEDYKLYKNKTNGITDPIKIVDEKVSSYVITSEGIFYSLHSKDAGYPGENIYKIDHDGKDTSLILQAQRIQGFTKFGDYIIFHSSDIDYDTEIRRLNIFTNKIENIRKDASIKEDHTPIINNNISIDYSGIEEFLGELSRDEITNLFSDIANGIFSEEDYEDNLDSILKNAFMKQGIDISDNIDQVKSGLIIKRSTMD